MLRNDINKRVLMGMNTIASVLFAASLFVMIGYIAHKYDLRMDVSRHQSFRLSDSTKRLLETLKTDVDIVVLGGVEHEIYEDMKLLLDMYEHISDRFRVEYVDPGRDLLRTREMVIEHGLNTANVIILVFEGRRKIISFDDLIGYGYIVPELAKEGHKGGFRGEQAISSAIQSLIAMSEPVVYFLAGHGEARIDDYNQYAGYSIITGAMRQENIIVKTLTIGEASAVPPDCDLLIVAGPVNPLTRDESDVIQSYLNNAGRMLLMLDKNITTGFEELLLDWGVQLGNDRVIGATLTGRELVVTDYVDHEITKGMQNIRTVFHMPRSVRPLTQPASEHAVTLADKPSSTILASSSASGWADTTPEKNPPVFDPEVDLPGPIPVAVAVEKGGLMDISVGLKSTRIVVVGDSFMVSNAALLAGYNADLFFGALNWLLEKEVFLDIASSTPQRMHLIMTLNGVKRVSLAIVIGIPAFVVLVAIMVWIARRK